MAAIWGIIRRNSSGIKENNYISGLFGKMGDSMSCFSFDRTDTIVCNNGFFACGHQYYTKEAKTDISPIRDEVNSLIFCSDCFLYNRDSLIKELNDISLQNEGDSKIAYHAFKKWGFSFVNKLRGIFSFAIYEERNNCLHLFSDHFARQYVVFSVLSDFVCFSTTYKPVLSCLDNDAPINREFIVNSYSSVSPLNFYKDSITPYENVFHLDYATHITINLDTGDKKCERYWNPLKNVKKLKLGSDNEYKEQFKDLFKNITKSMLRSDHETGIMLSGGLDSSAVASFAAPLLKEQGKNLYSYTSVPCTDFVDEKDNRNIMIDETSLVELQKEYYGNLIPHYINGDNDSCISNISFYQDLYNIPDKAPFNLINIDNMIKAAKKDNCSIILSGENGNASISYGYLPAIMSLNVLGFHFIKAYKEMAYACKLHRISQKKYFKKWIKGVGGYFFKKPEEYENLLKENDKKKYKLNHPALDGQKLYGSNAFVTKKQKNNFFLMSTAFTQKGFYYTHLCLLHHFIQLDPSLTVEMVEFCLSLPLECFVHNGIERRLCRDYLKEQMPEAITDMKKPRGIQAYDIHFRVNRDFDKYKEHIFKLLDNPLLKEYLDEEKLETKIKELKENAIKHTLDKAQAVDLTLLANLSEFLIKHTKKQDQGIQTNP